MTRRINGLRVACPLERLGCKQTFPHRQVSDHLGTCGFMLVHCSNSCGEMVYRKNLNDHLQECLCRPIRQQEHSDITEDHMTEESSKPDLTNLHFSWTTETALCTPTFQIDSQDVHLLLELTPDQGPRELLKKRQDGSLSLVLERNDCQSRLNALVIRVEEVAPPVLTTHSTPHTPPTSTSRNPPPSRLPLPSLRSVQVVCDRCSPGGMGNHGDGVVYVERIFGHPGLKERLRDGCEVVVTVTKHNCTHSIRTG